MTEKNTPTYYGQSHNTKIPPPNVLENASGLSSELSHLKEQKSHIQNKRRIGSLGLLLMAGFLGLSGMNDIAEHAMEPLIASVDYELEDVEDAKSVESETVSSIKVSSAVLAEDNQTYLIDVTTITSPSDTSDHIETKIAGISLRYLTYLQQNENEKVPQEDYKNAEKEFLKAAETYYTNLSYDTFNVTAYSEFMKYKQDIVKLNTDLEKPLQKLHQDTGDLTLSKETKKHMGGLPARLVISYESYFNDITALIEEGIQEKSKIKVLNATMNYKSLVDELTFYQELRVEGSEDYADYVKTNYENIEKKVTRFMN